MFVSCSFPLDVPSAHGIRVFQDSFYNSSPTHLCMFVECYTDRHGIPVHTCTGWSPRHGATKSGCLCSEKEKQNPELYNDCKACQSKWVFRMPQLKPLINIKNMIKISKDTRIILHIKWHQSSGEFYLFLFLFIVDDFSADIRLLFSWKMWLSFTIKCLFFICHDWHFGYTLSKNKTKNLRT